MDKDATTIIETGARKRSAIVAHDHKKEELFDWIEDNVERLRPHELSGTGTTSSLIRARFGLDIKSFLSGPVGGDQQVGAAIAEQSIDVLVFFWDPLEAQPHDPDVKALLRIAVLYDVVIATNPASCDYVFSSPLMTEPYSRRGVNTQTTLARRVKELGEQLD